MTAIRFLPPDAEAFAPYGRFVTPPQEAGTRAFYTEHLMAPGPGAPRFHVNKVRPSTLPLSCTRIERHPHADQTFLPLDVSRYLVAVMPSDSGGNPLPDQTLAFLLPGTLGVIYRTGVWHMGATVLDRVSSFAVLMHVRGDASDDEFRSIDAVTITAPAQMVHATP